MRQCTFICVKQRPRSLPSAPRFVQKVQQTANAVKWTQLLRTLRNLRIRVHREMFGSIIISSCSIKCFEKYQKLFVNFIRTCDLSIVTNVLEMMCYYDNKSQSKFLWMCCYDNKQISFSHFPEWPKSFNARVHPTLLSTSCNDVFIYWIQQLEWYFQSLYDLKKNLKSPAWHNSLAIHCM